MSHEASIEVRVIKIIWWLIAVILLLTVVFIILACRLLLGNHANDWKVFYGTTSERITLSKSVKSYWSRWRKRAEIPIKEMFPACLSSNEKIIARILAKQQGVWTGNLDYSGRNSDGVVFYQLGDSVDSKEYELQDDRIDKSLACHHAFFKLKMNVSTSISDYILLLVCIVSILSIAGLTITNFCII